MPFKDPQRRKEYAKSYQQRNLGKFRIYGKKFRQTHHQRELERGRKKRLRFAEIIREQDKIRNRKPARIMSKKTSSRNRNRTLRFEILSHYSKGTPRCAGCGNTDIRVLTFDHINNDGAKHKRELKGYGSSYLYWIKRNNYPTFLQVLCMNCQWIKRAEQDEKKFNDEIARLRRDESSV